MASDGSVLRALSPEGLADWRRLAATSFFPRLVAEGKIVATEEDAAAGLADGAAGVLRHETVSFVSYPYEWCFGMLKDAGLLQLDLLLAALGEEMTVKDASPYNVQWRGAQPVFVDVGSFEPLAAGEPWAGYRQFCMLFLYPLMLRAFRNVAYAPWLRGSLEGIPPADFRNLVSLRDRFRRGVLTHVVLHARLERRYAGRGGDVRKEIRAAGFRRELIEANARKLRKLVERLEWTPEPSVWSEYDATTSYSEADAERKEAFVRAAAGRRRWRLLWDLGCNDGRFTRIAAEHADYTVALDADAAVVEGFYRTLRSRGSTTILPLVADLADPPPGLGWRGCERRSLADRGRPDFVLCLALVHHLAIGANVPLRELVDWLRSLGAVLVVEFVTRDDPMVQRLLAAKKEGLHENYERSEFELLLQEAFELERTEELGSSTRVLYLARPRA